MNGLTRVMLVLLRLAIGWHFLFEGIEKIESVHKGRTETNRPWTSEPYLREASGPFGDFVRRQVGDLDEAALQRLTVKPLEPDQDPARLPARLRIPPALEKDWNEAFERFAAHYGLSDEQRKLAQSKLDQSKEQTVLWLLGGVQEVDKSFSSVSVKVQQTLPQRIQEYRDKLQQVKDLENRYLPAFEKDVGKQEIRTRKAEVARLRAELVTTLDRRLQDLLQDMPLTAEQKATGAVPAPARSSQLEWMDWLTRYGLTAVGLGLLLGLFTRTACLGGATFLLLFYLTMPALPWVPENLRAEGHYYYINKNLIEMLALLALATTRSGYWVGLDGLVHFLLPWNWRTRTPVSSTKPMPATARA